MKKKTIAKKRTPRKSSPKTPLKKTISKNTTTKVDSEKSLWCKQWLIEQKAEKVNTIPLQDELESDDSNELEGIKLVDESVSVLGLGQGQVTINLPNQLKIQCNLKDPHR